MSSRPTKKVSKKVVDDGLHTVSLRLETDKAEALQFMARITGLHQSQIMRRALWQWAESQGFTWPVTEEEAANKHIILRTNSVA